MSKDEVRPLTFSECVAERVRAVRRSRGWSVRDLAARCQQGGYPELTEGALYVLEGPRPRKVTVDEWLVLAYVLGVPPLTLALPTENTDYSVTPTVATRASRVANWILGKENLEPPLDQTATERMVRHLRYTAQWYEALPYLIPRKAPDNIPKLSGPELEQYLEASRLYAEDDIAAIEDLEYREAFNRLSNLRAKHSQDHAGGAE